MNLSVVNTKQQTRGNFFLIGFMGSGKSHWGKIWAEANQFAFFDLDTVIEDQVGKTVAAIFDLNGEDYFRGLEADVLRNCAQLQNTIVACGGGTPCFHENMHWMNKYGTTIYIACTSGEILSRILQEKEKRPLLKNLNPAELLSFIEQKVTERKPFYAQATITVQSSLLTEFSFPKIISTITN